MQRREFLAGLAAIGASALAPDVLTGAQTGPAAAPFRIDVHNHGNSPGFIAAIKAHNTGQTALMNWTPAKPRRPPLPRRLATRFSTPLA